MTIAPVQAVGSSPTQGLQQLAQAAANAPTPEATSSAPVSIESSVSQAQPSNETGFVDSVMDTVYTEIDRLGSQVPAASKLETPISAMKSQMAASGESINPMEASSIQNPKDEAVTALSKTFDHAIFMAMVNQVVSGVSDTSRTLIKQS